MKPESPIESQLDIDPRIYALYDEYCHGAMDRREFLAKAAALAAVSYTHLTLPTKA